MFRFKEFHRIFKILILSLIYPFLLIYIFLKVKTITSQWRAEDATPEAVQTSFPRMQ